MNSYNPKLFDQENNILKKSLISAFKKIYAKLHDYCYIKKIYLFCLQILGKRCFLYL